MNAVVFFEHGGPAGLRHTDVEPLIGLGEVLIRVRVCALNGVDLWIRRRLHGVMIPAPHIATGQNSISRRTLYSVASA